MLTLYSRSPVRVAGALSSWNPTRAPAFAVSSPSPSTSPSSNTIAMGGPAGPDSFAYLFEPVDLAPEISVEVARSPIHVTIDATFLLVDIIERGNLVFFTATFLGDPSEVYFAYMRPGENRPVVDPGFGQRESSIARIEEGIYAMVVDATGFRGGVLRWHFWGEGENQASAFGEVMFRDRPMQLL